MSRYRELARGQIVGDSYGVLKLLVSPEDRKLLGVHVFGTGATELIHIGQAVMGCGGTVDYLVDAVFNYPTLSESYKVAALDATNKMRAVTRLSASTSLSAQCRSPSRLLARNISCGTLVRGSKRAPGSVKLRTGGDSPRPGRNRGWLTR